MGVLLGGPKGMLVPLLNYLGGGGPGPPPSSYAYVIIQKLVGRRMTITFTAFGKRRVT